MPTSLTRSFRHGVPSGQNGEERPVPSNFPNGYGQKDQYKPKTALRPLPPSAAGVIPRAAAAPGAGPMTTGPIPITPGQRAERAARIARLGTPNKGGTISTEVAPGVTATQRVAPSAASPDLAPSRPNLGGTMTRDGVTTRVPPSAAAPIAPTPDAPVVSPTTTAAQQTESANPLTGDGNAQAGGTTDEVDAASALGLNRRGATTPEGDDSQASSGAIGGSGLYARKFSNPKSAGVYDSYIKKLFPS